MKHSIGLSFIYSIDGTSHYVVVAYRNARAATRAKCGKSPFFAAFEHLPTPLKLLKAIKAKVIWLSKEL